MLAAFLQHCADPEGLRKRHPTRMVRGINGAAVRAL
jgi:hypothetical protein